MKKRLSVWYWVFMVLLIIGLLISAVPGLLKLPFAVKHFTEELGYPEYFLGFTGFAKILGIIALLIPGFPRIKEWVFAGLTYDLVGAIYSTLSSGFPFVHSLPIFFDLALLSIVYKLYQRRSQVKLVSK